MPRERQVHWLLACTRPRACIALGSFLCAAFAAEHLRLSRGAFRGEPGQPAYGASKAGLNAFGQSLAIALAPYGITVATVAPGFVDTDMATKHLASPEGDAIRAQSPFQRVAEPEEIAAGVVYLASPQAEWASGAILDLNGASYLRS